MYNSLQVTKT